MEIFNPFQIFTLEDTLRIAIALVILAGGFISILYVIWWGFLMILSGGNEEKIKPAVNHIRHAIIGLAFLIGGLFIFPTLMDLIGVPYGEYLRPKAVLSSISDLSDYIFGQTVDTSSPFQPAGSSDITPDFTQIP